MSMKWKEVKSKGLDYMEASLLLTFAVNIEVTRRMGRQGNTSVIANQVFDSFKKAIEDGILDPSGVEIEFPQEDFDIFDDDDLLIDYELKVDEKGEVVVETFIEPEEEKTE